MVRRRTTVPSASTDAGRTTIPYRLPLEIGGAGGASSRGGIVGPSDGVEP